MLVCLLLCLTACGCGFDLLAYALVLVDLSFYYFILLFA